eukprot:TRINITY_DN74393_c0_g1_i1.p1 TRINITY_DN74393_c0_g1~~TRINITY_DN74393_c0_g1_i1.p1  ORF type:complete len:311 (+),score=24.50 TRINITY_DN74393_c0_g1_i1:239-1171(+)
MALQSLDNRLLEQRFAPSLTVKSRCNVACVSRFLRNFIRAARQRPRFLQPDPRSHIIDDSLVLWQSPEGWFGSVVNYEGGAADTEGPDSATPAVRCDSEGALLRLDPPLPMPADWTIACFFKLSSDGVPERAGDFAPQQWFRGEFALDCTDKDEQRVFYSVGRGHTLGTYSEEWEDDDMYRNLCDVAVGFRHCGYSFLGLRPGWHHLAAVGRKADNTTCYYIDGRPVGSALACIVGRPLCCIGNVSFSAVIDGQESRAQNQPWGSIADFRVYHKALTCDHIATLALLYDAARDVYFLRKRHFASTRSRQD